MATGFEYVFPAIQGVQAQREYYVSMCPMRLISKIFLFNEEELVPELRAQRQLNRSRVPEIARYMSGNPDGYVFSAITASVDGDVSFEPLSEHDGGGRIGVLRIAMDARFIINDGQHRRAAIEMALRDRPGTRRRDHLGRLLPGPEARTLPADVRGPQPLRRAALLVARCPLRQP